MLLQAEITMQFQISFNTSSSGTFKCIHTNLKCVYKKQYLLSYCYFCPPQTLGKDCLHFKAELTQLYHSQAVPLPKEVHTEVAKLPLKMLTASTALNSYHKFLEGIVLLVTRPNISQQSAKLKLFKIPQITTTRQILEGNFL